MKTTLFFAALVLIILARIETSFAQTPDSIPREGGTKVVLASIGTVKIFTKENGTSKNCIINKINPSFIVYEKDGSLHDLTIEKILRIEISKEEAIYFDSENKPKVKSISDLYPPLNKTLIKNDSLASNPIAAENKNSVVLPEISKEKPEEGKVQTDMGFEQGKKDAKQYYNGGASFGEGLLYGVTIVGSPIALISSACPPGDKSLCNAKNPNADQLKSNPEYYKGYKKSAHGKKAGNTVGGCFTGFGIVAMIMLLVSL